MDPVKPAQQTTNPSPLTPLPADAPAQHHKFHWQQMFLILLVAFLSAGVFGTLAYFAGLSKGMEQVQPPKLITKISPTKTVQPTPSGQMAEWKTYLDPTLGFSFHYPPTSQVKVLEKDPKLPDLLDPIIITVNENNATVQSLLYVWSNRGVRIIDTSSRDKWCSMLEKELLTTTGQLSCNPDAKLPEVTVGGMKAFTTSGGRDNSFVTIYYIPHDTYVYQWQITTANVSKQKYLIPQQIFSTFKFL